MRESKLDPRRAGRRLRELLGQALRQSLRPEQVALTLALGNTIGISPVYGSTVTTSTLVALGLRLNLPLMQAGLWMVWPLQLLLILPFIRLGERLWGHAPLPLDRTEILAVFQRGPLAVAGELGWALLHAFSAWLAVALFLAPLLYLAWLPLVRRVDRRRAASAPGASDPALGALEAPTPLDQPRSKAAAE
ncbi:MAG: DUF2062 domain-containing protein [Caldilineae bacterium]|nr:DUF2062 domain-containing protein [Chloroflexota bacterium]MCB9177417.1 DUF2062 domain-containing protein [Caldilineae bacterium]